MWKPDVVVPEHRYRARIVWGGLLLSITAYTIWQIWKIFDGLQNPSTGLEVTDDLYEFPYVLVCFFHTQGCGYADESTDTCVSDALQWSNVYLNGDLRENIVTESMWSNCLGFDLAKLDLGASGLTGEDALAEVYMEWRPTDVASTETDFYNHIAIYIADGEPTDSSLSFLYVPYTRYLPLDDEVEFSVAELTMGKTTKEDLGGDVRISYPPLILSTSELTKTNVYASSLTSSTTDDYAFGQLILQFRQGSFSRTMIKEINPLDIGTFLGNVGGFWELLIIFWGLFFIATSQDREPNLKARNFAKSIRTGTEIVTRRRSLSVDSSNAASRTEERPHWESAYRGDNHPNAATAVAGPFLGGGATSGGIAAAVGLPTFPPTNGGHNSASVATRRASSISNGSTGSGHPHIPDVSSSSHRRPVVQDVPRRGSRSGGAPPASHAPALPSYEDMAGV